MLWRMVWEAVVGLGPGLGIEVEGGGRGRLRRKTGRLRARRDELRRLEKGRGMGKAMARVRWWC